jgi:putative ABC transport system permease protein
MASLRAVITRVVSLFRRRQLDRNLDEEVLNHLELLAAEYERGGMSPADARLAARRAFGDVEPMKEVYRDRRGLPWIEILRHDVTYAARQLRRAPGFALAAILTLSLCLGATFTVFTVVDAVLYRPLVYPDAARLVALYARVEPFGRIPVSDAQVRAWRSTLATFDGMALIFGYDVNLSGSGDPERVAAARVTPELFRLLGVQPQRGRLLRDDEDVPGRDRVVVVSDQLWRRRFGADHGVIGRTMTLNGEIHEIVGVLPPDFRFPRVSHLYSIPGDFARPEIWKPIALRENDPFGGLNFAAIGRLKSAVTLRQAQEELNTVQKSLLQSRGASNATLAGEIVGLQDQITGSSRRGLEVLFASVLAVLAIACVNITNLVLARSVTRRRELAVRSSLGASRGRLVRQLFTEGAVLAILSGLIGLAVATLAVRLLVIAAPIDIPRLDEAGIDSGVLAFAALISLAAAAIVALLPAWRVSRLLPQDALKSGSAAAGSLQGGRPRLIQSSLVTGQIGLTIICAIVAGLLLQSLVRILTVDKGFESERVVTATIELAGPRYTGRRAGLERELIERLRAVPGVTSVAIAGQQLLSGVGMNFRVLAEGTVIPILQRPLANFRAVNADFFRTLGIALEQGQTFDEVEPRRVAVVSRSLAEQLWPGQEAVGKRLRRGPDNSPPIEVIGVAGNVRASRLDQAPGLIVYVPYSQLPISQMSFAVKTDSDPAGVSAAIRNVVRAVDVELPLAALGTMDDVVIESVAQRWFLTALIVVLAGAALALAAIGVYGVVSQGVVQRTPEIGLRLALGARRDVVVRMILREASRPVAAGLLLGVPIAAAASSLLAAMLFDVAPRDVATIVTACSVLTVAAMVAAYVPARRASRVDPMVALRNE